MRSLMARTQHKVRAARIAARPRRLRAVYGVIRRFSEDVDLTYDTRAIAGDLFDDANAPPCL